MHPPTGLWSSDDQTPANWAPSELGMPSPSSGPSEPSSATPAQGGNWEEEDVPTQTYTSAHLRAAVMGRASERNVRDVRDVRDVEAQVKPSRPVTQSYAQVQAEGSGELRPPPRPVDPATAAALASIQPLVRPAPPPPPQAPSRAARPSSPARPSVVGRVGRRASRQTLSGVQPPTLRAPGEAVAPAEQPVAEAPAVLPQDLSIAPPRARGRASWIGWVAAAVFFGVGFAFYTFAYVPLQAELARARQASAAQAQQQATLIRLQQDLQRKQEQAAAPQPPLAEPVAEPPVEAPPPAAEPEARAHTRAPAKHKEKDKAEPSEPKVTRGGVDRSAAAAATAELEAKAYTPGSAEPAPEAPKAVTKPAAEKPAAEPAPAARPSQQPLSDIENAPSNDPLEGL
jgi:hypothetical protein